MRKGGPISGWPFMPNAKLARTYLLSCQQKAILRHSGIGISQKLLHNTNLLPSIESSMLESALVSSGSSPPCLARHLMTGTATNHLLDHYFIVELRTYMHTCNGHE